jgi:hypothetical protein
MILSSRALGIYTYATMYGVSPTILEMVDALGESHRQVRKGLKELRTLNLIETVSYNINGNVKRETKLVVPEKWKLKATDTVVTISVTYNELLKLYSQYINIANKHLETKLLTNPRETRGEKNILHIGGNNVVYEPSADDKEYEAEKARLHLEATHERKKLAREQKQASHELKVFNRNEKEIKDWTPTDSSIEFAYQLHKRWDVAPFSVGESRLAFAMHEARATHDTNGVIEQKMIQMFLSEPYVQTMQDPNAIWKLFISKFSALAEQARYAIVDPEKQARAKKASDAAKRRLRED